MNPEEFLQYWSERPLDMDEFMQILDECYELRIYGLSPSWNDAAFSAGAADFKLSRNKFKDWLFERQGQVAKTRQEIGGGILREHSSTNRPLWDGTDTLLSLQYGPSYYESIGSPYSSEMSSFTMRDVGIVFGSGLSNLYQSGLSYESENTIEIYNQDTFENPSFNLGLIIEGTVTEISTPEGSDWLTYSLREAYQKFSRLADGSSLVFPLGMLHNPEFEEMECEHWDWEFEYVGKRLSPSLNYPGGPI